MFDFVRKHTKIMMIVMFLLIIPSFVLFGLDGYSRMQEKGEVVARVDGRDITQADWDAAHKLEVDRLRSTMPSLDPKLLDSPEARYSTLERMVRDRVLAATAVRANLTTSDQRLAQELQANETIASLRGPDGKLDMDRYRQLVGAQGMTPEMFENDVRNDVSRRQVMAGVAGSGLASAMQADVSLNAFFEKREVQIARFATAEYATRVNPTDAEIETFYKDNPALFQAPEQANIEYLVLDLDSVRKSITVNEADLKTYYEQNAARLAGQEERRASHILITAPKSASAAERDKARAMAQELLAAARKAPDSFADLAKKNSQDPGSAASGGDLDFFARGAMVKPFEDAAFAMKKGDISDVVESEFGYHIIKLTDIKTAKQRSFEEMKADLEADLKKQQAQRRFSESAEAFTNGVYEQADNLKSTADRLKLEVRTATGVTRQPAQGTTGVLANAKFLNALFSPDSIERKRNTEAVETASSQLVSGRITQYTPARTLPLAEVKAQVTQRLLAQRGAELAKKEGAEKLAAWKAAPDTAVLPPAMALSRESAQQMPSQIIDAALRLDAGALPAFAGVDLGPQGYAVVKVLKVLPREVASEATARQDRAQYVQWWTAAETMAYYNLLKEQVKAQIKVPKPVAAARDDASVQNR
ncbi:MAG: SurA N-terminal domain-containing protein [Proteobacteria bacterium]|jgi:peptidyl-prolyl cis-trans isomerase D|nr:SurA N-terminal domain-containing protein [Ramlibacter sp.]MCA0212550.1 SurA N-terminal domain-containing protein [Pseudomonadota bacterium]